MADAPLASLPDDWEATRATLHAYALGVGAIPRIHAVAHPQWWHASLKPRPTGLTTETMSLPGGGAFWLRMDIVHHVVMVEASTGQSYEVSMTAGLSGTEFADRLIDVVAGLGLDGPYDRSKFENDEPRSYDPAAAATFFGIVTDVAQMFERHRASLDPLAVGPIQLWPHGFDLSFEWFGTRTQIHDGEAVPAQLNLGFYPGSDRPYFYSNPWPFAAEELTSQALPSGAIWYTEGWEGSIIYLDQLAGAPDPAAALEAYAAAVYDAAAPTLTT